jgi:AmmeMemoRadiSam system protein B
MKRCNSKVLCFIVVLLTALVIFSFQANGEEPTGETTRPPAFAGTFYPGSPTQLRKAVASYYQQVPDTGSSGRILAAVAPHAGYVYSGAVAACTHKPLSSVEFDTVVIIGHDTFRDAVAFVCPVDYFQTPLGKIPVDREMMQKLQAFHHGIRADLTLHSREHTIEVQLPFLQVRNRPCKIIPVLFGNPTLENSRILADAILASAGEKTVFVLASADLSHYPPYDAACKVDTATLKAINSLDAKAFFNYLGNQSKLLPTTNLRTAVCASGGIGTAIFFAKAHGADSARILRYANSGDVKGGNKDRVVGYGSVLFLRNIE